MKIVLLLLAFGMTVQARAQSVSFTTTLDSVDSTRLNTALSNLGKKIQRASPGVDPEVRTEFNSADGAVRFRCVEDLLQGHSPSCTLSIDTSRSVPGISSIPINISANGLVILLKDQTDVDNIKRSVTSLDGRFKSSESVEVKLPNVSTPVLHPRLFVKCANGGHDVCEVDLIP